MRKSRLIQIVAASVAVMLAAGLFVAAKAPVSSLSTDEINRILDNAEA